VAKERWIGFEKEQASTAKLKQKARAVGKTTAPNTAEGQAARAAIKRSKCERCLAKCTVSRELLERKRRGVEVRHRHLKLPVQRIVQHKRRPQKASPAITYE
jgi:hypothetical protein